MLVIIVRYPLECLFFSQKWIGSCCSYPFSFTSSDSYLHNYLPPSNESQYLVLGPASTQSFMGGIESLRSTISPFFICINQACREPLLHIEPFSIYTQFQVQLMTVGLWYVIANASIYDASTVFFVMQDIQENSIPNFHSYITPMSNMKWNFTES